MLLKNLATDRCRIRRCALIVLCVDRIQGYKATSKKNWSGTGLNAAGMSASNIWDNANADDLETLPNTIPHRDVEPAIINSDREEFIQAYLVVDGVPQ